MNNLNKSNMDAKSIYIQNKKIISLYIYITKILVIFQQIQVLLKILIMKSKNNMILQMSLFQKQQYQIKYNKNKLKQGIKFFIKLIQIRDLRMIAHKLRYVLIPALRENDGRQLREWDLWGPLFFCLILAFVLSLSSDDNTNIFSIIFILVWGGSSIVTLNVNLLGGNAHFLQSLCVLGYCIFPIVIASIIITAFKFIVQNFIYKLIVVGISYLWSSTSSIAFMSSILPQEKKVLGVYPIFLFFLFVAWFCLFI
ncbi:hypothetical protein IMG5_063190 [Ichthyophthirius multifiliis]|uniref:Protein YIPF n=1 Tax=Ichthyophthirius multifiliis TaxID=5932 RepID=G0QP18_ICHMU|nr:hypothetical protein IMG5_063190 [Ichthyophthirius multifiliis]EGR33033.1 hypothetical protein IMG5_063190 [Ichthyophthirius multifiliis]|eukprot:XP_004037019.1 hypothetical protein IMG5_063190 [Ichthyophthirius multifiliis]